MNKRRIVYAWVWGVLLIWLLLCVSAMHVRAAGSGSAADVFGNGEDYTAILYDSSNGLPTSEANAIVQSSDGFIWLGGYSGFIRYDGTEFYRFDSSLGIASVFCLYADDQDRIWIGTNESGLAYYDRGMIFSYGIAEGLKSHSIRSLTGDANGNIIVGTTQGLAYVDAKTLELHTIDDPKINSEYITELVKDASGTVYGLTLDGDIFKVENLAISYFYSAESIGNFIINTISPDPETEGVFYLGTQEHEVYRATMGKKVLIDTYLLTGSLRNINAILKVGKNLWITSTNGIGYYDEHNKLHMVEDLPMSSNVGCILHDHEGNIWFTSTRQGIMKIVPDRFTDISRRANLDKMVVNTTCVRNNLLFLGADDGLVILNNNTYEKIENELTQKLKGIRIRCIKQDSKGNLWICTHSDYGLICYTKDKKITCYNNKNGLNASRVRAVKELNDGRIAAATGDGLFIIDQGNVVEQYGQENGVHTTEILSVEQGNDDKIYLGSDGAGIYVIENGKVSQIGIEDGLTSGVIMRIKWDETRKVFWLITSNSIQYMKDGVLHTVTNFPYSNNYDIIFTDNDSAWVLASNGVYVTKISQLMANKDIEYSFYNLKSGLPYITTGNSRNYVDDRGNLYISGTTGVCSVDMDPGEDYAKEIQLAIPSIAVDDKAVAVDGETTISVPAGTKKLSIDAYALTYGLENPRISYYLEGFDDQAIVTTKHDMGTVTYTNLEGGNYTFYLNVINDETGEVEKTEYINIIKEIAFYDTVWFWLLVTLISILIIFIIMRFYFQKKTQKLLEKQEEDRKFIDQIMHTFAKCVDMRDTQNQGHSFRVAYYTRMLAQKLAEKRGYTREQIDEFYHIALIHDIGKISIPDRILNKTDRLDDDEFKIMKSHAAKGEELLKDVRIVPNLAYGAGYHHERLDGRGYPRGLSRNEIPEAARIIAVADTFDAMYSTRPYRKQMELSDVVAELNRVRGTQLEEEVVDALTELASENKFNKEEVELHIKENIYGITEDGA